MVDFCVVVRGREGLRRRMSQELSAGAVDWESVFGLRDLGRSHSSGREPTGMFRPSMHLIRVGNVVGPASDRGESSR